MASLHSPTRVHIYLRQHAVHFLSRYVVDPTPFLFVFFSLVCPFFFFVLEGDSWSPGGPVSPSRRSLSPVPRREDDRERRRDLDERDGRRAEYDDRPMYDDRPPYDDRPSYDDRPPYDDRPMYDDRRPYDDRRGYDRGERRATSHLDASDVNPGNNLHVSGVSKLLDDRQLEDAFAKFGKVRFFFPLPSTYSKGGRWLTVTDGESFYSWGYRWSRRR